MIQKVTVYCASSDKVHKKYFEGAATIGRILAKNGITTVFGGGSAGLMGCLADSALANGGQVTGIIPRFMREVEWQHDGVTEMVLVDTMGERKHLLLQGVDAVVALPGGCGTFEELLEAITLKRLGKFLKPIIIFNQDGYYAPLLEMMEKAIGENFLAEAHRDIWTVIEEAEELLEAIKNTPNWEESAIQFAKV